MCGILFIRQSRSLAISSDRFERALQRQSWRGPDATRITEHADGKILIGHNRLAIIDPHPRSDQPMRSHNGRYEIVFNGEIYNHLELRQTFHLDCQHGSDTETLLELFVQMGPQAFDLLDGMFALVIADLESGQWWAARDGNGIKPLYYAHTAEATIIASEPATVQVLYPSSPDNDSLSELRLVRRPVPSFSFFEGIRELLPGHMLTDEGVSRFKSSDGKPHPETFNQGRLESLLRRSVHAHEMSDVPIVSMLSGGIDSGLITAISSVEKAYCVGLAENNESEAAGRTAQEAGKTLHNVMVTQQEMVETWKELTALRGEPLSVPNEGLIYLCCKAMAPAEKVVLTGEGADELFFGYDRIFRWASGAEWEGAEAFLHRYGYDETVKPTSRLLEYVEDLKSGKTVLEFLEDFFLQFHLPGLLRRMDFASMAASKEARVPFVSRELIKYMYRRDTRIKLSTNHSKQPLRYICEKLGLHSTLQVPKIGFSATPSSIHTRHQEYQQFYDLCLGELKWL